MSISGNTLKRKTEVYNTCRNIPFEDGKRYQEERIIVASITTRNYRTQGVR